MDDTDQISGIGMDMSKGEVLKAVQNRSNVAQMLTQAGPTGDSPAEIFADIINLHRLDIRKLGLIIGVEIEADRMTAERAGQLLAGTVEGDGVEIVRTFNRMEEKRNQLLQELLTETEYEAYLEAKQNSLHTTPPKDHDEANSEANSAEEDGDE